MQTVSFKTAKALKEAGFPQPEPNESGQGYFYGEYANNTMGVVLYGHFECASYDIEVEAYAPTATDLIPPGWYLIRKPADDDPNTEEWTCSEANTPEWFHDNNPAEAAAAAWLFVKRNQSNV